MPSGIMRYKPHGDTLRGKLQLDFKVVMTGNGTPANMTFTRTGGDRYVTSVTRTGVGMYRILLASKYKSLIGFHATIGDATARTTYVQFDAEDVDGSTPYVDFATRAPTAADNSALVDTDLANSVTLTVFIQLVLEDKA